MGYLPLDIVQMQSIIVESRAVRKLVPCSFPAYGKDLMLWIEYSDKVRCGTQYMAYPGLVTGHPWLHSTLRPALTVS